MVGSLQTPNSKKQEKENLTNPSSLSILALEDLSFSYTDSFLDFDYIKDWIEENPEPYSKSMASDLGKNPGGFSSEKVAFEVFDESPEMVSAGKLGSLDQEKVEFVGGEKGSEMGCQRFCEKIKVEEGVEGGEGVKLGGLGCSIEEEMGKVSLEGGLSALVSDFGGVSGNKQGGEGCGNASDENIGSCAVVESVGAAANVIGACGVESGVAVSYGWDDARIGEIINVDNSGEKNVKDGSDGDESGSGNVHNSGEKSVKDGSDEDESGSGSDSDSESESESESSSSSAYSSSSDSSDGDEEEGDDKGKWRMGVKERKGEKMDMEEGEIVASDPEEMVAWSGDEYDEDEGGSGIATLGPPRSKNELTVLPPVPPVNATLQPHHQIQPVGAVFSVLGVQVIVEGIEKHNPLNEGSILWITESRCPLGLVDEIFGPVRNPYYIVRYNSESEVPAGIKPGISISFVPEFANHVLNDKRLYTKGYDASGANDEELSEEEEFSDDEKEAEYRKMLKNKKRGTNDGKVGNKKKDEKRFGNWARKAKYDFTANRDLPMEASKQQVDRSRHHFPPTVVPLHQGNGLPSCTLGRGLPRQPGSAPPFAQLASTSGFNAFSGVANRMPFQQPQTAGFPGKSLYEKGFGASGANDDELLEEKSSDYKEAEYRKSLKNENRGTNNDKFGNQKKVGMISGNCYGNWKNDPAANSQLPLERPKLPVDHTKHHVPPLALHPDQGNGSFSGLGQALACQLGLAPPFPQLSLSSGFCASSGGANAIPFQQPPNFGLPQLPINVMPWVQQINQLHQIPSQNILPFQQQINAGPNFPSNLVLSGRESGFGAEPGFVTSAACLSQNTFNHSPFVMATLDQQASLPVSVGEQAASSSLSDTTHNLDSRQHSSLSGKQDKYKSFSHGKHYRGGKNPNRRGGGRFGGGRGRQQRG